MKDLLLSLSSKKTFYTIGSFAILAFITITTYSFYESVKTKNKITQNRLDMDSYYQKELEFHYLETITYRNSYKQPFPYDPISEIESKMIQDGYNHSQIGNIKNVAHGNAYIEWKRNREFEKNYNKNYSAQLRAL